NPNAPSVATFLDLRKDPRTGANAIEIVAPDTRAAAGIAQGLSSLPQVWRTQALDSFVPGGQNEKLKLIRAAAQTVEPLLKPAKPASPPTDAQSIGALTSTADTLSAIADHAQGAGADAARRLSTLLLQLANADPSVRQQVEIAVVRPLRPSLHQLQEELGPQ